ncbi:MAG: glycosyltransferase family 4 protein [Planctomycetota bacterium]|jgi:glycosyltransferase involved in cell wall biosynthesis
MPDAAGGKAAPLRVLHLYANHKWTGPADPAIRCAAALREVGADVVFAQAAWQLPDSEHRMAKELSRQQMPVIGGLELRRHFRPWRVWRAPRNLRKRLLGGEFNVLHGHQLGDHLIASVAKRGAGNGVVLVRSLYEPRAPDRGWRQRLAFGNTDGVVVPTKACGQQMQRRFGFPAERVLQLEPPVNRHRFEALQGDLRQQLGLADEHVAIGITARVQPHRQFQLVWEAARRVVDACPQARFVLLGRGDEQHVRRLILEPVARLGLEQHVLLPGYLDEPDYTLALRSLQIFLFLVPGSDGTCRAVREAMAAGLPIVTTKRGILPELVGQRHDGDAREPCGLIYDEVPELLAEGLVRLVQRPDLRKVLGEASLVRVRETMDPTVAGRRVLEFYEWLRQNPR